MNWIKSIALTTILVGVGVYFIGCSAEPFESLKSSRLDLKPSPYAHASLHQWANATVLETVKHEFVLGSYDICVKYAHANEIESIDFYNACAIVMHGADY
jgi:hypothetical protein